MARMPVARSIARRYALSRDTCHRNQLVVVWYSATESVTYVMQHA